MYQITPSSRNWGVMPLDRLKCPAAMCKARSVNAAVSEVRPGEGSDRGFVACDWLGEARLARARYFHSSDFAVRRYLCDLLRWVGKNARVKRLCDQLLNWNR